MLTSAWTFLQTHDWIFTVSGFVWLTVIILAGERRSGSGLGKPSLGQSPPTGKFSTLGFKLMIEECESMNKRYRALHLNYPEQTKKPLERNSWPHDSGPPNQWTYPQLEMYRLDGHFTAFKEATGQVWSDLGWAHLPDILLVGEQTFMVDLLPAIQSHVALLKMEIEKLLAMPVVT